MTRRYFLLACLCLTIAGSVVAQITPESVERLVADELRCPEGTEWEYAQSPDGEYSARWCQMTQGSQVARHGPYLELYSDGSTARQGVYVRGMQAGLWVRWTPAGQLDTYRILAPGESPTAGLRCRRPTAGRTSAPDAAGRT